MVSLFHISVSLAVGITASHGYNFVISNCDLPASLMDLEAPEYFEVLLAVHKRARAIRPNRPTGEISQISRIHQEASQHRAIAQSLLEALSHS